MRKGNKIVENAQLTKEKSKTKEKDKGIWGLFFYIPDLVYTE